MKTTITKCEYLSLLGLAAIRDKHENSLKEVLGAVQEITGEQDNPARINPLPK